jgi:hypothetical protein
MDSEKQWSVIMWTVVSFRLVPKEKQFIAQHPPLADSLNQPSLITVH